MADIRRPVGDIRPTQFINPGVEDNSGAAMLAAVGQGALNIDQAVAENKLRSELDDMRTIYETSSLTLTGAEAPGGLTQADVIEISKAKDRLGQMARAVEQGKMNVDMYRVTAEAALRAAIARRPGLAAEFRQLAGETLGTDVAGAGIQVLAQREASMYQEAQRELAATRSSEADVLKEQATRFRKVVESNQVLTQKFGRMPDAEMVRIITNPQTEEEQSLQVAFDDMQAVMAQKEYAGIVADKVQGEERATQRTRDTAFASVWGQRRAELSTLNVALADIVADGITAEERPELERILANIRQKEEEYAVKINSAGLTSDVAARYSRMIEDNLSFVNRTYERAASDPANAAKSLQNFVLIQAMSDDRAVGLSVMREIAGEQATAEYLGQDGEVLTQVMSMLALKRASGSGAKAIQEMAPNVLASVISSITGAGTKEISPSTMTGHLAGINTALDAFLESSVGDYNMQAVGGPSGVMHFFGANTGSQIASRLSEDQRAEVGDKIVNIANRQLAIAQASFRKTYPNLVDKVEFRLKEDGSFVRGTGALTPTERNIVETFERSVGGKRFLEAARVFRVENPLQRIATATPPTPTTQPAPARATTTGAAVQEPTGSPADDAAALRAAWPRG